MKAVRIKLPFGLNERNALVHVADVESGRKCGCICPSCRSPLIAAKGSIKQHHFKHAVDTDCESGLESAIHLAAKQMILERRRLTLPECVSVASATDSRGKEHKEQEIVVRDGTVVRFDSVQEEVALHGMKADILATMGDKPLMIEIFYRHKVDDEKYLKMVKAMVSAVEIDLSDLTPGDVKDWETFWSRINDPKRLRWLYNTKASDAVYKKLEIKLRTRLHRLEAQYEREEVKRKKREQNERAQLLSALEELKVVRSEAHIERLKKEAEDHPTWKRSSLSLPFSWPDLPNFLNVDVSDGDWIFGCDRRIWQTAFYAAFIRRERGSLVFTTKRVAEWLKDKADCRVPRCAEIVGIYGRRYSELVPYEVSGKLPSSWATLRFYLFYLCEVGMLELSGDDWKHPGSHWFKIVSKDPVSKRNRGPGGSSYRS